MPLTNYFFFFLSSCDIKTKKPQPRAKSQATTFHNQSLSPSLFPQFNFPGGLFSIKSCRIYQWLCCAPVTITTSPSLKSVKFRSFYPQSLGGKREVGTPTFYLYYRQCVSFRNQNHTSQKKMNYRMKLCAFSFFLLLLFQKSPAQNATLDPSEGIPSSTISVFCFLCTHCVQKHGSILLASGIEVVFHSNFTLSFLLQSLHLLPFVLIEICYVGM